MSLGSDAHFNLEVTANYGKNSIDRNVRSQLPLELAQMRKMMQRHAARLGLNPQPLLRILENTQLEQRFTVLGEELIDREPSLKESNDLYIRTCLDLGERVARAAIARAGLTPQDIDSIISVSCTGYMIPSIDAYLLNQLQMRSDLRRTPITELGCMAGAVALSRAWEQLSAYPNSRILVLSIELPSLTFQRHDPRPAQLISSMIFSDGAAAVGLSNKPAPRPSPWIIGSRTYTVAGTIQEMGYDLENDGLHIILSSKVPLLIRSTLRKEVEALLHQHELTRSDLKWCAMHPAGPKVLTVVEEELELSTEQLGAAWNVLRQYGNMSSAAVLFVLAEMMVEAPIQAGDIGIIVAFGPGVTGEIVLARWEA